MNKLILICAFFLVSGNGSLRAQETLNRYLVTAAENNPGLKARFSDYQAALQKVPQAGALPDAQVTFGYFIRPVETRAGPQQARFSVMQMFPWFGTLQARENEAIRQAKAKYESFLQSKSELFYEVRSSWYDLYVTEKAIDIAISNIGILHSFKKLALIRMETGQGSAIDELRVEMAVADLENQLAALKDKLSAQTVAFNRLLNTGSQNRIALPDTLHDAALPLSKASLLDSIRKNNHRILELDHLAVSYIHQEKAAGKSGWPGFSVGLDYIATGMPDNPSAGNSLNGQDAILFPKIGISIPLYRNKYKAMIREAVFRQESTRYKKDDKTNALESLFEKVHAGYLDAGRRTDLFLKQLDLAGKSLDILESDYSTGGQDFEELLRMERKLLNYSLELEKARADKLTARAMIDYLMGR